VRTAHAAVNVEGILLVAALTATPLCVCVPFRRDMLTITWLRYLLWRGELMFIISWRAARGSTLRLAHRSPAAATDVINACFFLSGGKLKRQLANQRLYGRTTTRRATLSSGGRVKPTPR